MQKPLEPLPPFGPLYNVEGAALKKFRKAGVINREYGLAVLAAVRTLQNRSLRGAAEGPPPPKPREGRAILAEVAAQQRASLAGAAAKERRARTPRQWQALYEAAMTEKRARETLPVAA